MSNIQVKNECVLISNSGFVRSIVIDVETNHPRPVWRSDRSNGNNPSAGTYQQARDNDIVIMVTIAPDTVEKVRLNFYVVKDGILTITDGSFNYHPVINSITTLVREWLYDQSSQPYLPKGVGWDGENPEIEKIKMEKALSILPKGIPEPHLYSIKAAISYTPISVFNDVKTTTQVKSNIIIIPDCHIYIEADKDNNVIGINRPVFDLSNDGIPVAVRSNTCKVYIIWYSTLKNNMSKKIALDIVELI